MWDNWVLDASMGYPFCFSPIEGDLTSGNFKIVSGFNVIGDRPPGRLIAIVHDGQGSVDAYYAAHKAEIDAIFDDTASGRE